MTRTEMLNYIQENHYKRVKHRFFSDEEYLYMADDGFVYDENGYLFENWTSNMNCGLRLRVGDYWENDWYAC